MSLVGKENLDIRDPNQPELKLYETALDQSRSVSAFQTNEAPCAPADTRTSDDVDSA